MKFNFNEYEGRKNITYQHIEKLGTSEVEGILEGEVNLFYKIDGTNGLIFLKDDGTLGFGSRNRELSLENDNQGFMNAICNDHELYNKFLNFLTKNPNYIVYGEWLIPVTIKRYKGDAWKKFYIFDILDVSKKEYLSYDEYSTVLDSLELNYIPRIVKLNNPTFEEVRTYLDQTGSFLINEGLGEGIVLKNYNYKNRYGRRTWAKILCEDFLNSKKKLRSSNAEEKQENFVEHQIITKFLTPEHVFKEQSKLMEKYGGWSSKYIFELLNRVFNEFFKDNWELILKKFHNPTINFRVLKQYSDNFVKETLSL